MAESRKRSRKSKIVVRVESDIVETENAILQRFPEVKVPKLLQPPAKILDHTYSLQHASAPLSPIKLAVKVEVEEFDESFMGQESEVTNDSANTPGAFVDCSKQFYRRHKSMIRVFQVNLEKMYKISDHIIWSSTNPADKYLSIEMKNIWGRALKSEEEKDPYNDLILSALHDWELGFAHCKSAPRDAPLFYQCHICNQAWWCLSPFKDHIRSHNHRLLKVYYQRTIHESIIVASNVFSAERKYIYCAGNCYRCGKDFHCHLKAGDRTYRCEDCFEMFANCSMLLDHWSTCVKRDKVQLALSKKCQLCSARYFQDHDLQCHMTARHSVRSDIPNPFFAKTCSTCRKKYHQYSMHMCSKASMSSGCLDCYRKFSTKHLADCHMVTVQKNYKCKICNVVLPKQCMETEHMLQHTDNYCMVYKCIHPSCPQTMVYPDETSIKLHRTIYHKQKHDKRRTFFEMVLVPKLCFKPDTLTDSEHVATCRAEILGVDTDIYSETGPKSEEIIEESIKKEAEGIELECTDGDSQDSEMDYEQMLSNLFKASNGEETAKPLAVSTSQHAMPKLSEVSTSGQSALNTFKLTNSKVTSKVFKASQNKMPKVLQVSTSGRSMPKVIEASTSQQSLLKPLQVYGTVQPLSNVFHVSNSVRYSLPLVDSMDIQIKTEPEEINFEDLIDIQDDPITIKQEPIDSYYCNEISIEEPCDVGTNLIMEESCHIKTEPRELEIDDFYDRNIGIVKMEQKMNADVNRELIEATDIKIMESLSQKSKALIKNPTPIVPKDKKPITLIIQKHNDKANATGIIDQVKKQCNNPDWSQEEPPVTPADYFQKPRPKNANSILRKTKLLKRHKNCQGKTKAIKKKPKLNPCGDFNKRIYTCGQCGYANNHKLYRVHKNSNCELSPSMEEDKKFMCTKCDTPFSTLKSYLVHFHKHGYDLLHCPSCNVKFESMKDLLPHFQKHVRSNFVNCWMINRKLDIPTERQHRCQACREIVPFECFFAHWESHLILKPKIKEEPVPVEIDTDVDTVANKRTLQPTVLRVALQQLRNPKREKECIVCNRKFNRRHDCKRHVIEHLLMDAYSKKEKTPQNTLRCQICLEDFHGADKYKFHMREHGSLPVYRCNICNKTFSDSSNFAKHKKIHSIKVLICDICSKKFHAKSSMEKHMLMHRVTEPIVCEICTKKFYSQSHFNKHIQVRHYRITKFKCILCEIWFDSLRKKWDHMWLVHKERKHKADCPICRQGFRKFQDVKFHAKMEHNIEMSFFNIRSDLANLAKQKRLCKTEKAESVVVSSHLDDYLPPRNKRATQNKFARIILKKEIVELPEDNVKETEILNTN